MRFRYAALIVLLYGWTLLVNGSAVDAQTEDLDSIRKSQNERMLSYQQRQQTRIETKTEIYTVSVPATRQVARQVIVPVRRLQYYWESRGILGRRQVLRCREITVLQTQTVVSSVTTTRSEQRTREVLSEVVKFEEPIDNPELVATNGGEEQGVNIQLGPIPASLAPTFERMRVFFDDSKDPLFEVPEKNGELEEVIVHSKWSAGKPEEKRQARVTVAATPFGTNQILLTVRGLQVLSGADPENLTTGDYVARDDSLKKYVDEIGDRITKAFVEPTN